MKKGCAYGTHRVLEPKGVFPQPALKIDNTMEVHSNEILINVKTLNIDSSSFNQIKKEAKGDVREIKNIIHRIVEERGKLHNPITGSGGMLIGVVEKIGTELKGKIDLNVGDKIATLVSLSLTPLKIDEILEIRKDVEQVDIKGKAILFETGIYVKLPEDFSDNLSLAILDVAGAPAQVAKKATLGDTVVVIGAGKAGILCLYEARKRVNFTGTVVCIEYSKEQCELVKKLDLADIVIQANGREPVEVYNKYQEVMGDNLADLTVNTVNVPDTEMASIIITKDKGTILFFSMATDFGKAALGAEGLGKDVNMLVGNGYTKDHAEIALNILRESNELKYIYTSIYN